MNASLPKLAAKVISERRIGIDEVKAIRRCVFSEEEIAHHMFDEEIVDRDEAEMLFQINDAVSTGDYHESWADLLVEAITSHVLKDELSAGELDEEEAKFLIDRIENDGKVDSTELELLVNISANVNRTPEGFQKFVRDAIENDAVEAGTIDEKRVRWIRRVIFGSGSSSGRIVDQTEKTWLRKIDEIVKGKANHVSWEILKRVLEIA